MNKFKSTLEIFKIIIKYASYIYVIIDILQFAHDRINKELEKENNNDNTRS